jgi:hypothetical protein
MEYAEKRKIAETVMKELYIAWESHNELDSEELRLEHQWDRGTFETVLHYLEHYRYFVENDGTGVVITTRGIEHLEEIGLSDRQRTFLHQRAREHVLDFLSNLYDRQGIDAVATYEEVSDQSMVDETEIRLAIEYLQNVGWLEVVSSSTFKITYAGLDNYENGHLFPTLI